MGLLGKLMGSRPAKPGVEPVPVDKMRTTLLGLDRGTEPWHVRDGAEDGCDLVAEWRIVDAQWQGTNSSENSLNKVFRVKMKFDEGTHEVRNASQQTTTSSRKGRPRGGNVWSRGQMNQNRAGGALGFNQAAQLGGGPSYSFNSNEIIRPLRDAVNKHGWGWKAVVFKL
jgi:hypothetical protein